MAGTLPLISHEHFVSFEKKYIKTNVTITGAVFPCYSLFPTCIGHLVRP